MYSCCNFPQCCRLTQILFLRTTQIIYPAITTTSSLNIHHRLLPFSITIFPQNYPSNNSRAATSSIANASYRPCHPLLTSA